MSEDLSKCECGKPTRFIIRPPWVPKPIPMCNFMFKTFLHDHLSDTHKYLRLQHRIKHGSRTA